MWKETPPREMEEPRPTPRVSPSSKSLAGDAPENGDAAVHINSPASTGRLVEEPEPGSTGCVGKLRNTLRRWDPFRNIFIRWSLSILLVLFLAFLVFGTLYSGVYYHDNCSSLLAENHSRYYLDGYGFCETPFGTLLGVTNGVFGYSNCDSNYISVEYHSINGSALSFTTNSDGSTTQITVTKSFSTGLAWQCVEFARRYWMMHGSPKPAYFGSVDGAADIWNLTQVYVMENTSVRLPLLRYENGGSVSNGLKVPAEGDLVIYPIQSGGFPYGHVAVIVKVELSGTQGVVYVAEQNWENKMWPGPYHNYSRKLTLKYSSSAMTYTIDDPEGTIVGWMRYS